VVLEMDKITKILNRIEDNKNLKETQLKEVEADYNLIGQNRKIKTLKRDIKRDFWTQAKGWIIFIYAILGTIATTSISIAGGYTDFEHEIIFGLGMIVIQSGLFLLTQSLTTIRDNYPRFLIPVKMLQLGLLILSIKFNYNFFNNSKHFNLITLILCVCFDVTILISIAISADFRSLNFHKNNDMDLNNMGFIKMLIFNMTAKWRINILRAFNYNKAQYKKAQKENNIYIDENTSIKSEMTKGTESQKTIQADEKKLLKDGKQESFVLSNDRDILLSAIFENKDQENICPSLSKLEDITGLSRAKITRVKKELVDEGILTTEGRKTVVNVNSIESLN
jgi:hypothetical protein